MIQSQRESRRSATSRSALPSVRQQLVASFKVHDED